MGRVRTRTAGGSACEGCVRGTPRAGPGPACHAYPPPLCPARSRAADGDRRGQDPWLSGSGAARGLPRPASCPRPRPPHSPGPAGEARGAARAQCPPPHRPGREAAHGARRLLPGARLWLPLSGRQVRAGGRAALRLRVAPPSPGAQVREAAAGGAPRGARRAGLGTHRGARVCPRAEERGRARSAAPRLPLQLLHPKESAVFRQLHSAHQRGTASRVRCHIQTTDCSLSIPAGCCDFFFNHLRVMPCKMGLTKHSQLTLLGNRTQNPLEVRSEVERKDITLSSLPSQR